MKAHPMQGVPLDVAEAARAEPSDQAAHTGFQSGLRSSTLMLDVDLIDAAYRGDTLLVDHLLGLGANVNASGLFGESALHSAAFEGHEDVCLQLLDAGALVNNVNARGESVVFSAVKGMQVEVVRLLLERGGDPNGAGGKLPTEDTPLQRAARAGSAELCILLVNAGADIDRRPGGGFSALHLAAILNKAEVCQALISLGARTDLKARNATPATLAKRQGNMALCALIKEMEKSNQAGAAVDEVIAMMNLPSNTAHRLR